MKSLLISSRYKAFTLIELLVVVAIIGILAAVGVVAYNGYTKSAKISSSKSYHDQVTKAIKLDFFQSCEIEGKSTTNKAGIFCNLTGEKLARTIASKQPDEFELDRNLENPAGEKWIMYTPAAGLNSNVINASPKQIGRLHIYEVAGNCFGFVTTLGDGQDVIKQEFCYR